MFPNPFKSSRGHIPHRFLRKKSNKGYTLLFTILIMFFIFSVTISFFSITRKESNLSSGVHESLYALYAADTGIECAQYYNPGTTTPLSLPCGDSVLVESPWAIVSPNTYSSTFAIFFTEENESCARVTIKKSYDTNGNLNSSIESWGYNLGSSPTCPIDHPAVVERALRLTY